MADPIHITHVVLSLDLGGLERLVIELVRQGQTLGQRPTVLCLERPGKLASEVEALGVPVVCVHKRPGLRMGTIGRIYKVLRKLRPDVVHTHQIAALFYGGPAARAVRVPVVVHTEHGKHYSSRRRTRWLGWIAGRYTARYFCVSEDIAREVRSLRIVPAEKIRVVPNGIDAARFQGTGEGETVRCELGIPMDAPVIGTVGRLDEIKRQDLLLQAFAGLRAVVPEAHLLLVGDGPLRDALREQAAGLGLTDWTHFVGYQSHPERYFQAMDVFALTSRSEGMPLVVLEAWAAGLSVVASRVGGLPQMIEDGRTGLLFDSGDQPALEAALGRLVNDRPWSRQMGEAGRRLVEERYGMARMVREYLRHYEELLARNKAIATV